MSHVYQLSGASNIVIQSDKYLGMGDIIELPWGLIEVVNTIDYIKERTLTELCVEEYTPQAAVSVTKLKKVSDAPYYLTLSAGYKVVYKKSEVVLKEDKRIREVISAMRDIWSEIEYYKFENRTITLYSGAKTE